MYYWRRACSILLRAHLADSYTPNMMISGWTAEHAVTRTQFGRHLSEFGLIKVGWALWFPLKKIYVIKEWKWFYDWKICFCSMYQTGKREKNSINCFQRGKNQRFVWTCVPCAWDFMLLLKLAVMTDTSQIWWSMHMIPDKANTANRFLWSKYYTPSDFDIVQHTKQCITSQTKEKNTHAKISSDQVH